jgi:hypothetical protein
MCFVNFILINFSCPQGEMRERNQEALFHICTGLPGNIGNLTKPYFASGV